MAQTTVSPKFQVVIPKEVRQQVPIFKGQRLGVIVKNGLITLVPDRPIAEMRGFLRGIPTEGVREKKDRM
ncbi:MAG: AbrB/MazE/SpoVT family DNA-binding domain-containing protein [Acidobacteriota bacterium]